MMRSGSVHAGFHYNRAMKPQRALLTLVAGLACLPAWGIASHPAFAVGDRHAGAASVFATGLTLDEAVARVEKMYSARVVRAEEKRSGERRVYRIRLLSADGRVFDVTVDADSGRIE